MVGRISGTGFAGWDMGIEPSGVDMYTLQPSCTEKCDEIGHVGINRALKVEEL